MQLLIPVSFPLLILKLAEVFTQNSMLKAKPKVVGEV